ncbi:hypothetical protein [Psychroserpens sp. MEBiC05023]
MQLVEKYKQYGFTYFIQRLVLGGLKKIGIRIDRWLVCNQKISIGNEPSLSAGFQVKELFYQDFVDSNRFNSEKLNSFKSRFKKESFKAYGILCGNKLAYYCWISLDEFQFSKNLYQANLEANQGLLFDAFCFSEFRGKGLHNFMNFFRLKKLLEFGKSDAVVILLIQNKPARKSQKKAGFECSKIITTYNIFGKIGHYMSYKKINL